VWLALGISEAVLQNLENAIGFKGFAWYTKEALENLYEIWISNFSDFLKTPRT